ncbi:MAG: helix-turn-helix transcriptional regulator [Chloroflexi bacterium]|nr:helix-turn-helix transcriptional regulator [Chloroflexota bacterium]
MVVGPRRLSTQQIARAAHVSVGSLYYYFPSKRDLVLCGLRTDVLAHRCAAFHRWADHLRRSDPPGYLSAFVESSADSILFLRPAVYAAIELGSAALWPSLEVALAANTQEFQDARRGALSISEARVPGLARLGRTWRRFVFGAVLDREAPRQERRTVSARLCAGWRHLSLSCTPAACRPPQSPSGPNQAAPGAPDRPHRRFAAQDAAALFTI